MMHFFKFLVNVFLFDLTWNSQGNNLSMLVLDWMLVPFSIKSASRIKLNSQHAFNVARLKRYLLWLEGIIILHLHCLYVVCGDYLCMQCLYPWFSVQNLLFFPMENFLGEILEGIPHISFNDGQGQCCRCITCTPNPEGLDLNPWPHCLKPGWFKLIELTHWVNIMYLFNFCVQYF